MNKDKIQVGDLVWRTHGYGRKYYGIGLVICINYPFAAIYWFKLGETVEILFRFLTKLEIPNE
jgi:hypothetical protein